MKSNPYFNSTTVKQLHQALIQKKQPKLAFLDIDSTFDGEKTNQTRKLLEKMGYVIIFNTSRTEELIMSEKQRKTSKHFTRPAPHLGKIEFRQDEIKKTIFYYLDPSTTEPKGVLNPDIIIGSTGTAIWIKQFKGGYEQDLQYQKEFGITSSEWRKIVMNMLLELKKTEHFNLSQLENPKNYEKNRTNVFPPDFRIQILFNTIANLKSFINKINKIKKRFSKNIRLTNDSKPDKGKFVLYLTPLNASKSHAQEHVIRNVSKLLKIERKELKIFIAGDSWPDLIMGINGKSESETFLLVGGSRLFKDLIRTMHKTDGKNHFYHFSGENLKPIVRRFIPTAEKGFYYYNSTRKGQIRIILGDEKYQNTKGVESVLAYLNENSE